jgi:hypothetical protein
MSTTIVLSQPIASLVAEAYKECEINLKFLGLYTIYLPEGQSFPTSTWISMILNVWEDFAQAKLDITPDVLVEEMENWAMDNTQDEEQAVGVMQQAEAFREELFFSDCLSESIEFSFQHSDEIYGSPYGNSEDPFWGTCFTPENQPAMRKHIRFSM